MVKDDGITSLIFSEFLYFSLVFVILVYVVKMTTEFKFLHLPGVSDDLQQVIALLREEDFGAPLQFSNFRD